MQLTKSDNKITKRVEVEDHFVTSPNFRTMKKFLRNRSDYAETAASNHTVVEQPICGQKIDRKEIKPVVQPPLPPYPPPPDSPPQLNVTIKQEIIDEDEQPSLISEDSLDTITATQEAPMEINGGCRRKTICKEFVRGNCKRTVCKFAHEIDVSQLAGVFTFCWNYQNSGCTFPNCRFVHASVFEEAEFYRTGVLPPHARSHLQQELPSPPPPEASSLNSNSPTSLHPVVNQPSAMINCVPAFPACVEQDFRPTLPPTNSPQKRQWAEMNEFSSSPRDLESIMAKKCKKCEINELSIKYHKDAVDTLMHSNEELKKKMGLLNKKNRKLLNVFVTLLKPAASNKSSLNNMGISSEKEKFMLEKLNNFVSTNNRLSAAIEEDSYKNAMGSNINLSNFIAKLLPSTGDHTTSDTTLAKCS